MQKLKKTIGNYVTGEDFFWDREQEIALFIELLDEGANILMAAPRRIGKTSLVREVATRISARYYFLNVDLQKAESPADAVAELSRETRPYTGLWDKTKALFRNILDGAKTNIESLSIEELTITLRSGLTGGDWREKGDALFRMLSEADKPVVIALDEFPVLINRLLKGKEFRITPETEAETDVFMSWIREKTMRHKGKIRIVITGSIGIEPLLRQAHLSATINSFTPFQLSAWSEAIASGCLNALANQYGVSLSPQAVTRVIEKLGYLIPHHVQMFFDNIYAECKFRSLKQVTADHVEEIYNTRMLSIQGHAELSHMEERLKTALGMELYAVALEFLTEAACVGQLDSKSAMAICRGYETGDLKPDHMLTEILDILQHDGYLRQVEDRFEFVSRLLRDWWKRRFGFAYTAILQRRR